MSENWKPGDPDVAQIAWTSTSKRHGGNGLALRCSDDIDESHWVTQTFGVIPDAWVTDARRLVVIDPDDREQVERLIEGLRTSGAWRGIMTKEVAYAGVSSALREFANPSPPKPTEPLGLGAVVEDANGLLWCRDVEGVDSQGEWYRKGATACQKYATITAVRVLSQGVTA